jgi:seryl-tRNA synthetase
MAAALRKRGKGAETDATLNHILELDEERRALLARSEALKARRNQVSKEIPMLKKNGEDATALLEEMRQTSDDIKRYDDEVRAVDGQLKDSLLSVPNRPDASVPAGADDTENVFVRDFMTPAAFDFEPKPHWELCAASGMTDPEMAARVTGARFIFYKGAGARLERAVMNFMLHTHAARGYCEIIPPYLVSEASMYGTGQLPKFAEDAYATTDGLYLIPTAEVPVTNMYRDQILDAADLPLRYVAGSPCFRSEAGSAGRDTRGLIRQHQFHKVELVKFCKPEESCAELESLLADADHILKLLELPYRVMLLCGGDMGFSAAKTNDIEVWMPSYGRYVEISSCSNCGDFQARRANIRFRDPDGKLKFAHTLNGSGLAVGRTVAAIIENYQQADGAIQMPAALRDHFGGDVIR